MLIKPGRRLRSPEDHDSMSLKSPAVVGSIVFCLPADSQLFTALERSASPP